MKKLILLPFLYLSMTSAFAADLSFVGDFIEVFKFSQNGFWGSNNRGCSNCAGFAETTCPKHSERMIKSNIKYGVLGYFNDEKKYENCTRHLGILNEKDISWMHMQFDRKVDRTFLPSSRAYRKCLDKFSLEKGRSESERQKLLGVLEAMEVYHRLNINHHQKLQWERVQFLKSLPITQENKKEIAKLQEYSRDLASMDSCFNSDINCFGASGTFKTVPFYRFNEVENSSAKLTDQARAYLEAASCLSR